MKRSFNAVAWSGVFKKIAIATFAFAVLFTLHTMAVYVSETNPATQEQISSGGRVSTEREERILLPSGIRERMDELEFERSGTRGRTERESRGIRIGLRNAS